MENAPIVGWVMFGALGGWLLSYAGKHLLDRTILPLVIDKISVINRTLALRRARQISSRYVLLSIMHHNPTKALAFFNGRNSSGPISLLALIFVMVSMDFFKSEEVAQYLGGKVSLGEELRAIIQLILLGISIFTAYWMLYMQAKRSLDAAHLWHFEDYGPRQAKRINALLEKSGMKRPEILEWFRSMEEHIGSKRISSDP